MFKTIRGLFFGLLIFTLSLFVKNQQIFAVESINSFYSRIEINQDTSLFITEQIEYTTTVSKHGIYRYIPITYNKDGQVEVLPISNIAVTDDSGVKIPFTRSTDNKFITLKIGDPDVTFSGDKVYVISYTVERGINKLEAYDELSWDITGEGWTIPIQKSSATIISKFADLKDVKCYSGPYGGNDGLCNFEAGQNQATFTYLEEINYGDNMTVVINFPKDNQLIFPTQNQLYILWLKYNWPIFLLPFPLLIIFILWYKKGRDIEFISQDVFNLDPNKPSQVQPIKFSHREPMVYEPLKDLTAGESGALIDGRVDTQDIVAEILELARKKYIKINVTEKKVLFSKTRDYSFQKLAETSKGLNEVQAYLFDELFKTGNLVSVSSLKGKFHTVISQARSKIQNSLFDKQIYTDKPIKAKSTAILLYVLMIGGLFFLYQFLLFPLGIYWPLVVLFIQAPLGLWLANSSSQKTAVGTNLWLQSRGLKATIKRGAWREKIKEKNLFIEEVLPFAVSLGVVNQLAKDMEDLNIKPPEYISTNGLATFAVADFVGGFSQEVGNSLSYNPSSSSSGGGFSGGGGGGGGGGSW